MFKRAQQGKIMIERTEFIEDLAANKIKNEKQENLILLAEKLEIIFTREIEVTATKTFKFICLKLEVISYEALHWVMNYFKFNLLKPTVKSIKRIIKEAYCLNLQFDVWNELFLESVKTKRVIYKRLNMDKDLKTKIERENQKFKFHNADLEHNTIL